jgi:hypothetical protein
MSQNMSEVARIKRQIVAEYEAGQQALSGLSLGTARHDFITKRVENMSSMTMQLVALVGEAQAGQFLVEVGL